MCTTGRIASCYSSSTACPARIRPERWTSSLTIRRWQSTSARTSGTDSCMDDVELLARRRGNLTWSAVRHGQLSPVFFGSALTNFGVEPFLEDFLQHDHAAAAPGGGLRHNRPLQPGFLRFCFQDPGKYEQGPPGPAGLYAHLLRQVRAGRGSITMSREARKCACPSPSR